MIKLFDVFSIIFLELQNADLYHLQHSCALSYNTNTSIRSENFYAKVLKCFHNLPWLKNPINIAVPPMGLQNPSAPTVPSPTPSLGSLCSVQWLAESICLCICQALAEPLRRQSYQAPVSKHFLASIDAGEDMEKEEHSSIAAGIKSLYNHSGNQYGSSSENWT